MSRGRRGLTLRHLRRTDEDDILEVEEITQYGGIFYRRKGVHDRRTKKDKWLTGWRKIRREKREGVSSKKS